ncbi:MAG TPA: NAD(P)-dependent oxidoreductase [Gammaproteobacteria bacterium]|nr:NAD(P)-dependent oxidoreductase [Gammaproteobacteria bacterium]
MLKTGFIGLGSMGYPMALNLHKAGLLYGVWNRTSATAERFASDAPCVVANTPEALVKNCDAVVLCVSADDDVLSLVNTIAPTLSKNTIVIDCSTVSAQTARQAEATLAEQDCHFLDCPVSGGTEGAQKGSLSIMCGGSESAFKQARPIFDAMGSRSLYMGPSGAGQATKAVNQIMVAGINQAVSEALAFAQAENLPLDNVIEATGAGAAASWFLSNRGPNMQRDSYPLGFKVGLHDKDLEIVQRMAAAHDVQLPVVEMTRLHYKRLLQNKEDNEDISSLFRLKRALFEEGQ